MVMEFCTNGIDTHSQHDISVGLTQCITGSLSSVMKGGLVDVTWAQVFQWAIDMVLRSDQLIPCKGVNT